MANLATDLATEMIQAGLEWKQIPAQSQPDFIDHQSNPIAITGAFSAVFRGSQVEVYKGEGCQMLGPPPGEPLYEMTFYALRDPSGNLLQTTSAAQLFDQAAIIAANNSFKEEVTGVRTQCVPVFSVVAGDVITHGDFEPAGDYVVESTDRELSDRQYVHFVQKVVARKLDSDGKFDPEGAQIEFTLGKNHVFTGRYTDTLDHVLKVGQKTQSFT